MTLVFNSFELMALIGATVLRLRVWNPSRNVFFGTEEETGDADSGSGIQAREMGGPLEAQTTNGGLEIDLVRLDEGGVRLECTNGGIELRLPSDARASIDASITNGGIDTGGLTLQTIESSRRRLEATMNGGGPRVQARCTNGGFELMGR